ncbi:hypothetical protein CSOJ01_03507 [Colletotrichum sojae]|uniref:Uncharacterized protein n=1 Tax=Colletotrichum sojae TaxID=2175907 RepID=A0A8H6JLG7_9PEZI|nr:hypothetical protein CSOJ01_03507 [Colletotrichum sojae]
MRSDPKFPTTARRTDPRSGTLVFEVARGVAARAAAPSALRPPVLAEHAGTRKVVNDEKKTTLRSAPCHVLVGSPGPVKTAKHFAKTLAQGNQSPSGGSR